jgi:hypothetical protein
MGVPFVIFQNSGEIDPATIKTFGVSVKEGENPIGYFGTGLKYALAILTRLNHEVVIYSGETVYKIDKKVKEVRGKEFYVITINGEELPYTTELGKNWKAWQAFREIYCNCIDEKGSAWESSKLPVPQKGFTKIVIKGKDLYDCYLSRQEIVIDVSKDLLLKSRPGIEIYNTPSKFIYYRGVRVHELLKKAMFTYNVIEETELTEDRTLLNYHRVENRLALHIASMESKEYVRKILNSGNDYFERFLSFDWLDWNEEFVSNSFMDVLEEEFNSNNDATSKTALKYFRKRRDKDALKNYSTSELTPVEGMALERCIQVCSRMYPDFKDYEILVVGTLGSSTMALADMEKKAIIISKDCFRLGKKFLLSTLLEEYMHLKTGFGDHTRQLQTYLFDTISTLIEEHILKEPV